MTVKCHSMPWVVTGYNQMMANGAGTSPICKHFMITTSNLTSPSRNLHTVPDNSQGLLTSHQFHINFKTDSLYLTKVRGSTHQLIRGLHTVPDNSQGFFTSNQLQNGFIVPDESQGLNTSTPNRKNATGSLLTVPDASQGLIIPITIKEYQL